MVVSVAILLFVLILVFILVLMFILIPILLILAYDKIVNMKAVTDKKIIETARKYNLNLDSMKCEAFALFDQGYAQKEVRYLLRSYRDPRSPEIFSNTIRKYYSLWYRIQQT